MTPRAHKRLRTLVVADGYRSKLALEFTHAKLEHFASRSAAEAERDRLWRRGERCYLIEPERTEIPA
jgi:hypothetical protein